MDPYFYNLMYGGGLPPPVIDMSGMGMGMGDLSGMGGMPPGHLVGMPPAGHLGHPGIGVPPPNIGNYPQQPPATHNPLSPHYGPSYVDPTYGYNNPATSNTTQSSSGSYVDPLYQQQPTHQQPLPTGAASTYEQTFGAPATSSYDHNAYNTSNTGYGNTNTTPSSGYYDYNSGNNVTSTAVSSNNYYNTSSSVGNYNTPTNTSPTSRYNSTPSQSSSVSSYGYDSSTGQYKSASPTNSGVGVYGTPNTTTTSTATTTPSNTGYDYSQSYSNLNSVGNYNQPQQQQQQQPDQYQEYWRQYYEQQKQIEVEQERQRSQERERIAQQQQQEHERMQNELQKQREDVERMKQDLLSQQRNQQLRGEESKKQMELERQNILSWQQEEMKRQMYEVQREREMARKHEEEVRQALMAEQQAQQARLNDQANQLLQQRTAIENKMRQDEANRMELERKQAQELAQREKDLAQRRLQLEEERKKSEQATSLAESRKQQVAKQSEEYKKKQEEMQREKELLESQKRKEEKERQDIRMEFERNKAMEQARLKEVQDQLKREQDLLNIQRKELMIERQQAKQAIDSLSPMRDLVQAINLNGQPTQPAQPKQLPPQVPPKTPSSMTIKAPTKQAPKPPASSPSPPLPTQPRPSVVVTSPPAPAVQKQAPQAPRFPAMDMNAVVEGYKIGDVVRAQRAARKWLSRQKFRRIVMMKLHATDPETENQRKRHKAVNEVYTTEVSYLNSLLILQNFYFIPMEVEAKITKLFKSDEIQKVFSNLRSLVQLSSDFLFEFEQRLNHYPIVIGDVFLKFAPIFKIYVEYINNFDTASPKVKQMVESPQCATFFAEQKKKSRSTSDIFSLLIMPVQRIPRYELLLREILSHTEQDHVEYNGIKVAHESIKNINKYINDRKKNVDNRTKLLEMQKDIKNAPELLASHRYFVREGACVISSTKKHESGSVFLIFFNDLLLVTKKTGFFSSYKYEYLYTIPLKHTELKTVQGHDDMIRMITGQLESMDVVIYTLCFSSPQETAKWTSDLTNESSLKENMIKIDAPQI